ncbi:MAG: 50S ribosomal protein L29 [Bacteroidales bacterium]|nr:50S ribosomal protein L29 [Bacteroidales bacterium]
MKTSEIIDIPEKELVEKLDNEKDYMIRLKLNHAISPLDNPLKIKDTRRNIAKILTEMNRRKKETGTQTEKSE